MDAADRLRFFPDGKSAALCTWNGDVWRVDGLEGNGELHWQRLVTGLFQPLGLKFRQGEFFVCCRDQIARFRDLNGDRETDFIENFNNDHQVTTHFHEFAMGLQTDEAGNFYYAKSARHALPAVVPHHGTLLRVSADGSRTDIIAHGFRAANGVCLNPDGTFFVTDQEGHWTPKNRINHVIPDGGFYRLRPTGQPTHLPTTVTARTGQISLTFTDPLNPATQTDAFSLKTWNLQAPQGNRLTSSLHHTIHSLPTPDPAIAH